MNTCPKCESNRIIPRARALDHAHYSGDVGFHIAVDENPDAWVFKNSEVSAVRAAVCGNCGYIEFYAVEPEALYQTYLNSQRNV